MSTTQEGVIRLLQAVRRDVKIFLMSDSLPEMEQVKGHLSALLPQM